VLLLVVASFLIMGLGPSSTGTLGVLAFVDSTILLISLWTSGFGQGRKVLVIIPVVGLVAALAQLADAGSTTRVSVSLLQVVFLLASCLAIGLGVLDQQDVNRQSVLGALSIYVMIGLLFALLYGAVADISSDPFFAQGDDASPSIRLYFSFVTLATLGYGDYTPAGDVGRILAVFEALLGQLYLVTVVAVLVANLGRTRGQRS
jgi:hypothetical protein